MVGCQRGSHVTILLDPHFDPSYEICPRNFHTITCLLHLGAFLSPLTGMRSPGR